jgi:hypothetical protein
MAKGYSRIATHKTPNPDTQYKERTTGWALFPEEREDAYEKMPSEKILDAMMTAKLLTRQAKPAPGYLYHVTYMNRINAIAEEGLALNSSPSIGGMAYEGHKQGRIFLTDADGVSFWLTRAEQFAYDQADNPVEEGYVPIVLRTKNTARLHAEADEIGSSDSGSHAFYVSKTIPASQLEYWGSTQWSGVSGLGVSEEEYRLGGDDEGYLNMDAPLFHPKLAAAAVGGIHE